MTDILIKHGTLLTQNNQSEIIYDGAIAIEGNEIVANEINNIIKKKRY